MNDDWRVDIPEGESGDWRVERFTMSRTPFLNPYGFGNRGRRGVRKGEQYTRLMRGRTLVMSDVPDEMSDYLWAKNRAEGVCLVNGLGIGMVVQAMLRKKAVEKVVAVELSEDVASLVGPHLSERFGDRFELVVANALKWTPPKGIRYGLVWHDIFDNCCVDNLPLMTKLKRRYGRRCDWQGCWSEDRCRVQLERDKRVGWY